MLKIFIERSNATDSSTIATVTTLTLPWSKGARLADAQLDLRIDRVDVRHRPREPARDRTNERVRYHLSIFFLVPEDLGDDILARQMQSCMLQVNSNESYL